MLATPASLDFQFSVEPMSHDGVPGGNEETVVVEAVAVAEKSKGRRTLTRRPFAFSPDTTAHIRQLWISNGKYFVAIR